MAAKNISVIKNPTAYACTFHCSVGKKMARARRGDCIRAGIWWLHSLEIFVCGPLRAEKHSNRSRQRASPASSHPHYYYLYFSFFFFALTIAPFSLKIHMAPLAIIKPLAAGFHFDAAGAHVHDQVEETIQQLDGKEIGPGFALGRRPQQAAVAEQQQTTGLRGAKVQRYGACLLCVPPGQCQVGRRRVKGDRLQGLHALAAERQVAMDTYFWVPLLSQPWQLQSEFIILVDHLINERNVALRWQLRKAIGPAQKLGYDSLINEAMNATHARL